MNRADDILDNISSRKTSGESFVLATVVRTVAATAAKAGAKAVILPDGTISQGWITALAPALAAVAATVRTTVASAKGSPFAFMSEMWSRMSAAWSMARPFRSWQDTVRVRQGFRDYGPGRRDRRKATPPACRAPEENSRASRSAD